MNLSAQVFSLTIDSCSSESGLMRSRHNHLIILQFLEHQVYVKAFFKQMNHAEENFPVVFLPPWGESLVHAAWQRHLVFSLLHSGLAGPRMNYLVRMSLCLQQMNRCCEQKIIWHTVSHEQTMTGINVIMFLNKL